MPSTACCFQAQACKGRKATAPHHAWWLGWVGLNQVPSVTQPELLGLGMNHYSEGMQGGEMEEREAEQYLGWGERCYWRTEGGEEQADMNDLLAT